ncbi:MAG TPA: PAS domain-containing protein, partial [Methylotenera sp.]|nr:PAS domain-containing protein [Methylotenera sp.]
MDNILNQSRINELKSFAILDDASKSNFERLTQLVARLCQTPIATITLIDEGREYFEYTFGSDTRENNQASIFHPFAIQSKELLVIPDAEKDSRFVRTSQADSEPYVKFYAGMPLISKSGGVLGVLAIQDYDPHTLTPLQKETLQTLAEQMVVQLEFFYQRFYQEQLTSEIQLLKLAAFHQSTKLKETQRISHIGSWELNVKDSLLKWSDETYQIFGVSKGAFNETFEAFLSFVHPDDLTKLLAKQNDALQGKRPLDCVYRIIRPNGELRFVHERAEWTLDIEGQADLLYGSVQDVTEQKIRELTLAQNEAIVRATFAAANAGIAMTELDGTFVIANPAYCKMIGYAEEEICSLDFIALTHPDDRQRNLEQINRLLKGEFESFIIEKKCFKKNGDTVWLRDNISLIRSNDGNPTNIITVTEDITSEKLVEEELQKTQSLLKIASQISRMGGWSITLPDWKLTWSDEVAVIHDEPPGYSPILSDGFDYYVEECRESIEQAVQACVRDGTAYDLELQIVTRKGRAVWVRTIGQAVRDVKANIVGLQGAYQDISARKKAEQEKQDALIRMQRIASRLPGMIYEFRQRPDGTISMPYVSEAIRNIFRLSPEDVIDNATLIFNKIHPDDLDSVKTSLQTSAAHLSPWIKEFRLRFENGEVTWVSGSALPQYEADGSVLWHGFTTDITASRKSQEQLELLEVCISRLSDIVLITEAEPFSAPGPKILFVNDAFEQRTGFTREEAIGQTPRILQGPKTQRSELDRIHRALEKWQPVRAELINYTKSGEEFWVELDIVPVADENGLYTHWIAVEREITERKQVELELSRLNRALLMYNSLTQSIIQASDENDLLNKACELAVDVGGYCLAWIGYAHDDSEKTIQPITAYGSG